MNSGLVTMVVFFGLTATVVLAGRFVAPAVLQRWSPPEPLEMRIIRVDPNLKLGIPIPDELRDEKLPLKLVVHVDCLGCVVKVPTAVEESFRNPEVLNLVLAEDTAAYESIAKSIKGSRMRVGSASLVEKLHAAFGPRLYYFNNEGRLEYVQTSQKATLAEELRAIEE